jgi:hypothetical protein
MKYYREKISWICILVISMAFRTQKRYINNQTSLCSYLSVIYFNYFRTDSILFSSFFTQSKGKQANFVPETPDFPENISNNFNSCCISPRINAPIQVSTMLRQAINGRSANLLRQAINGRSASAFHSTWLASGLYKSLQITCLTRSLWNDFYFLSFELSFHYPSFWLSKR